MPIYEYQCTACGHQLEAFQKITDKPLTECPDCHKNALNKLISSTSFQLKGTGWYVTDFRDKDKPKQTTEKTDVKSEGSDSNTTKTEPTTVDKQTKETKSETKSTDSSSTKE